MTMRLFISSEILPPNRSKIIQTKLNPIRLGTSRLYVTFVSDQICSSTKTIPLEIVQTLADLNSTTNLNKLIENEKKLSDEEDAKLLSSASSMTTIGSGNAEKQTPMSESPTSNDELAMIENEDDDVDELYLKKDSARLHPHSQPSGKSNANGSTLSLDRDKMSLDSLDVTNDRHFPSSSNLTT